MIFRAIEPREWTAEQPDQPVIELLPYQRAALERHLRALDRDDRRLRFGFSIADATVREYVASIDFANDSVFAIVDDDCEVLGAAHLSPSGAQAELGLSVLRDHRNRGIGAALLSRAALRARSRGARALFMHCLRENGAILHLARKRGMRIATEHGETSAGLELPPADAASRLEELRAERAHPRCTGRITSGSGFAADVEAGITAPT